MVSMEEARRELQKLIERYNKHKEEKTFLSNEKQACQSLIVPLIKEVLHWDVYDPSEFKTEESQGGKRIDYVVLNQGISQFIVEAKAPSKEIFDNDEYYKQAIGYGYGKQRDFAILTNFREFVILACQVKFRAPREAELLRFNLLTVSEGELNALLAFEKGYWLEKGKENLLYSRLVKHTKSIPVDEQLLDDMKEWREQLLRNIRANSRWNKFDFDDDQEFMRVEEEVQKFIDRLIFICFCEDKELYEPRLKQFSYDKKERFGMKPGWLLGKIQELFAEYRRVYDSDLFDKSEVDSFKIDDDKILEVIEQLREPRGRAAYDFKSIEADILGKTYENFIGHVQTGKKRFKEKEDIGKRKKSGIYYTPKHIVDYIVNNTVREYVKGKSLDEIKKIKVLDPACGSGSFLRVALDVLIEESKKALKRDLTYEEKVEILLNCIFGVDLDERAVEIAKFNLSLKLAERGKPLPMLRDNIKHGNSLIDDKNVAGYAAFEWEERFKEIMDNGGFDVVIGNPPYVMIENLPSAERDFMMSHFETALKRFDIYVGFIEKSIKLIRDAGLVSFIIPYQFLTQDYAEKLREYILKNCRISQIVDFSQQKIFKEAAVRNIILIIEKGKSEKETTIVHSLGPNSYNSFNLNQEIFSAIPEKKFRTNINQANIKILDKVISNSFKLGEIAIASWGARGVPKEKFQLDEPVNDLCKKMIKGKNLNRYNIVYKGKWFLYDTKKLYRPAFAELFENEKLIFRGVIDKRGLVASYDNNKYYTDHSLNCLILKYNLKGKDKSFFGQRKINITDKDIELSKKFNLKFILAILNSKIVNFYFKLYFSDELHVYPETIEQLPIPNVSESQQTLFMRLADKMLSCNKRLNEIGEKETEEKKSIQKEIEKTDHQIDELVYKIYGITEEEKKIIEESLK